MSKNDVILKAAEQLVQSLDHTAACFEKLASAFPGIDIEVLSIQETRVLNDHFHTMKELSARMAASHAVLAARIGASS